MIGDQLGEEVTRVSFRVAGNLTSKALKALFRLLLVKLVGGGIKKGVQLVANTNKKSIRKLTEGDKQVEGIEVSKNEVKGFQKYAKKYNLDYSLVREKNDPNHYFLSFKSKDLDKLSMCIKDFLNDKSLDNDSLEEKLKNAQERANTVNRNREQEKEKNKNVKKDRGDRER